MNELSVARDGGELPQVNHMRIHRLADSLFSKELAPHYMELSKKLASSELVPKSFRGKPQDLFICWAMGYQVGMTPEQAMQCIAVINGKPAMWGDEVLALCMAHKDFEDIEEMPVKDKNDQIVGYLCTVWRKGRKPKINEFTLDMAKKAGLLAKGGVWAQYPERMLKLRARAFCLRDAFPDALKGIKSREEVEDYIEAEFRVVEDKGSRTETLKHDYLTKTGSLDADPMENDADIAVGEEASQDPVSDRVDAVGEEAIDYTAEITRLIVEKGVFEERLAKALAYYEVDNIESLSKESAEHFIAKLNKL